MTILLGIDPGSRFTGYGLLRLDGSRYQYLASGAIATHSSLSGTESSLPTRLVKIFTELEKIIQIYQPDEAAIEQVFVHANPTSALKLGQARGVAMVVAAKQGIPVSEYSARQVKQALVGFGAAQKDQVEHMVKLLLNIKNKLSADEADALGVAICHAHARKLLFSAQKTIIPMRRRKKRFSLTHITERI